MVQKEWYDRAGPDLIEQQKLKGLKDPDKLAKGARAEVKGEA